MQLCRLCVTALLLLAVSAEISASGRFYVEEVEGYRPLRDLLQSTPNCSRVHPACSTCRNQRIPGTRRSQLVCSVCKSGYRLRRDGQSKTCDCAPGLAFDENGVCQSCPMGQYCPGGDARSNPNNAALNCPEGLQTTFAGAKSQAQCFTKPGFGRVSTRQTTGMTALSAVQCEIGTYNMGKNVAGCQKCGPGLTTAATGSTSMEDCLAPAGSYMDRSVGKLCQRGTYSTELNTSPFCIPCPAGITTPSEGSISQANCSVALMGYYISDTVNLVASPCPLDTYNDREDFVTECTPCPYGWKTKDTGAGGVPLCLAPPGFELVEGNDRITECKIGWYKQDWNRNPCISCGDGLITSTEGSVTKDSCLVPAGYGIVQYSPLVAVPCERNTYGDSVERTAAFNARCVACPQDMYTSDTLEGVARAELGELYTSQLDCKVLPGWGTTSTMPTKCPVGTYNEGKNRQPCKQCPTGYTTTGEGKSNATLCVIQPGWQLGEDNIPAPCNKGTYSVGGNDEEPHVQCQTCPTGYSTQVDESTKPTDCEVCSPGYGGQGCQLCAPGSFSWGGSADGTPCAQCAEGTTSQRGATQSQQCVPELVVAVGDVFNLADESAWIDEPAATGSLACGEACTASATCVMYRYGTTDGTTNKCQLFNEDATNGDKVLGFKVQHIADEFVTYKIPDAQSVGVGFDTQVGVSEAQCLERCALQPRCELYMFSSAAVCILAESEFDADFTSMFSVKGDHLYSNRSV